MGTGLSREQSDLMMERKIVCLFLLESGQVIQCHRLGWGSNSIRQRLPEGGVHSPGHRLQNMLLLATSILTWQGVFGPDFVFQSGLNVQSTLGQNQRLVSGQMAGPEVRKGLHGSRGSIVVRTTRGVSMEEPRTE